jgi:hypothetical protein
VAGRHRASLLRGVPGSTLSLIVSARRAPLAFLKDDNASPSFRESTVALRRILARDPVLAGPATWRNTLVIRGPPTVPMAFGCTSSGGLTQRAYSRSRHPRSLSADIGRISKLRALPELITRLIVP